MLLRYRNTRYNVYLAIGQLSLVIGILLNRFVPRFLTSDFCTGCCYGLSGVLIGLSIVMNVTGMVKYRQMKNGLE